MRKTVVLFVLLLICISSLTAQNRSIYPESSVITNHEVTIKGVRVQYRATAGTQPVWNEDGKPVATLFYTFYERTGVKNPKSRPLFISFNGGPGSSSVWMHLGYTGPRNLIIDDEGYPVQPYGIRENPHSILDVADIVFVNPVNVAYSRILDKETDPSLFFGVEADIKYLAEWISSFVTNQKRWVSPKYLIGESYGTTRVSGLALELQSSQWMYINGVILVSPTSLGIDRSGPVSGALKLPYFAAAAWHHKALDQELLNRDLEDILPEVEKFTIDQVIPAITRGGFLDMDKKKEIASKMAYYSGLSEKTFLQHNLVVPTSYYWKDLLRDKGLTIGRLDSRYRGIDRQDAGERYAYDQASSSWSHAFAPAINMYIKDHLKFKTNTKYNVYGSVRPWNRGEDNTGDNLGEAMAKNPFMHVMIQSGYYDGACDYFSAKYTMWQIDPSGKLRDRFTFKAYRSGHMMYLRQEDLKTSNEDIREFIKKSIPKKGKPAKY